MSKLFKLSGIFSAITLFIIIFIIMLQQELFVDFENEFYFKIKLGLTINYAFWSFVFIIGTIKDILRIKNDIKKLKK